MRHRRFGRFADFFALLADGADFFVALALATTALRFATFALGFATFATFAAFATFATFATDVASRWRELRFAAE